MQFLCSNHREQLIDQPAFELEQLGEQWITNAVEHYDLERWDYALPYIGSALELCWIEAEKYQMIPSRLAIKSLCLAIYCSNILHHLCDPSNSDAILAMNWQHLSDKISKQVKGHLGFLCSCSSSRSELHQELIKQHTSWPFKCEHEAKKLILH